MQVTLQKDETSDSEHLVIEGVAYPESWGSRRFGSGKIMGAMYELTSDCRFLTRCTFAELEMQFDSLSLPYRPEWCDDIYTAEVECSGKWVSVPSIKLEFRFWSDDWAAPWSVNQYCAEVIAAVAASSIEGLQCFYDDDVVSNNFGFQWPIGDMDGNLETELELWAPRLAELMEEVEARLRVKAGPNTLVNIFEFPPEVETACQQYLVYFGQFLADLGIQADVGLGREAHKILFSVTPADPNEALQTLRDALHAYLQLPSDAELRKELYTSSDIAAMQLRANVLHLESQLQLGAAMLEAKNQTIEALRVENYLLKQVPPPALPPLPAPSAKPDAEPLIPNLVTVKDIEIKGIVIHAPEFIRSLKRRFGRNKN